MEVLHRKCAGLDVHKDSVVACARTMTGHKVTREVETFGTTTRELLRLVEWLEKHEITITVMEATGVYWRPVWHILEGHGELVLANAHEVRNVPGRKTDVNDAMWLADLVACGLVRSSFVPPEPIQDLRDLTRTRKQLTREIVGHTQRIQKVLETCNIKLSSVASDVLGVSGRAILRAIIKGESDPVKLAELARGTLRAKRGRLVEALLGKVRDHHRFLLEQHLGLIETIERAVAKIEAEVDTALAPFHDAVERLQTIPGVGLTAARTIIAEIGPDMSRFPTAGHLRSWAGLCPRMDESAGKRRNTRIRKGAQWLKPVLIQCAWSAIRSAGYLKSQFLRLKARRGPKKAIVAVAASILGAVYAILKDGQVYRDLGADHFTRNDRMRTVTKLTNRLRQLGYEVELHAAA
jgi:transposase